MRPSIRQRGIAHVVIVLMAMGLVAFVGLAIDTFHAVLVGQQLQIGADASALAGAHEVRLDVDQSIVQANSFANQNSAFKESILLNPNPDNLAAGDLVIGRYNRDTKVFTPRMTAANAVKIVARRDDGSASGRLPLLFGPIFGVTHTDVSRYAIAFNGGSTGGGLIALDETEPCTFMISGSTLLDVADGAIYVNSNNDNAACHNGANTSFTSPELNVVGGIDRNFIEQVTTVPEFELKHPEDPIPDPLAGLEPPDYSTWDDEGTVNLSGAGEEAYLSPGFYSGGISMSSGYIHMDPGIYVVDGAGFDVRGGDVDAFGVMVYIIDSTPDDNLESHVYLGGNGVINISGPDPTDAALNFAGADYYEGVTFFQARDNTNEATIIGTGDMNLEGTFYFSAAKLLASGTNITIGNQLIVGQIELNGNGRITINYEGRNQWVGDRVYLVE
ncbi:MAG: TadG family pilus assembly protein [Planctomycetota bacterium]|jgi:hypothetical protein